MIQQVWWVEGENEQREKYYLWFLEEKKSASFGEKKNKTKQRA